MANNNPEKNNDETNKFSYPNPLSNNICKLLTKQILNHLVILLNLVSLQDEDLFFNNCIQDAIVKLNLNHLKAQYDGSNQMGDQLDALIDIIYCTLNITNFMGLEIKQIKPPINVFYQKVMEFTIATLNENENLPNKPTLLSLDLCKRVCHMVIEEIVELLSTIWTVIDQNMEEYLMENILELIAKHDTTQQQLDNNISNQSNTLFNIVENVLTIIPLMNLDFEKGFDLVHQANMKKVDQQSGKVKRRQDGKILKPDNWTPPDMVQFVIEQQKKYQCEEND